MSGIIIGAVFSSIFGFRCIFSKIESKFKQFNTMLCPKIKHRLIAIYTKMNLKYNIDLKLEIFEILNFNKSKYNVGYSVY